MSVNKIYKTRNASEVFSHLVDVENITAKGRELTFSPTEGQRKSLCKALNLLEIEGWDATALLSRTEDGLGVSLRVNLSATVIQSCVITLEPVSTCIEHSFHNLYLPEAQISATYEGDGLEIVIEDDDEDFPEVLKPEGVDVGEATLEQLALVIDPYPRKEGVSLQGERKQGAGVEQERENPFAALRSWR